MIGLAMAKKDQNYYPVQTEMLFQQGTGTGLQVCEVNRALSGLNRRLYRQNRVYRVKVDMIQPITASNAVDVYRLRNTFMLQRGYELAMESWNESFENAEEVVKDANVARWRDFRIDTISFPGDTKINPLTLKAQGPKVLSEPVVIDEWNTSLAWNTAGASRDFGLISDSNTFGIIHEYDKQGKVQAAPSTSTTEAAYGELKADLDNAEVMSLQADGNFPPYDADSSTPLSVLEYVGTVYVDSNGQGKLSTGYFDAPLGVVYLFGGGQKVNSIYLSDDTSTQTNMFKISAQKGDYKGVAAHEFVDVTDMGA